MGRTICLTTRSNSQIGHIGRFEVHVVLMLWVIVEGSRKAVGTTKGTALALAKLLASAWDPPRESLDHKPRTRRLFRRTSMCIGRRDTNTHLSCYRYTFSEAWRSARDGWLRRRLTMRRSTSRDSEMQRRTLNATSCGYRAFAGLGSGS
jgi:hypothetical protein